MMIDVNSVSDETSDYLDTTADSYPDTSAQTYQMGVDQNMTADEYWLHYNTTEIYQSYQNKSTDDEMTTEQYSTLLFALLIFKWIMFPFIVTANDLTIIVAMKYVKKITPSRVGIAFLSFTVLLVGIFPFLNLVIHVMGDSVHLRYVIICLFIVVPGLNISAMLLIAFERFILVTSWKWHQNHLTVRRQIGLCIAFCVYFLLSATILTLLLDSEFKYEVLVLRSKWKAIIPVLVVPTYTLVTCTITYCYLKICLFIWKQRKNPCLKSKQL